LPTLGFYLETAFREANYSEAAALLYSFYLLIASLKYWMRPRLVLIYIGIAFFLVSKEISLSLENVIRFFTYEILPWPMRREGVIAGTQAVTFAWEPLWAWALEIIQEDAMEGVKNTVILTQVTLVLTGILTLLSFPTISPHFTKKGFRQIAYYALIILRTTPEYIFAYLFVMLWGPSMLPGIWAISLHNGAILAYLSGQNANLVKLGIDTPLKKLNRYFFEILPRVYGQFLAFLFYRWEVMMRESAILGILGIYTLGFYIDSAITDQQLDKAIFLIVITALLNMGIDTISQIIRKRMKVSTKLISSY